MRSTRSTRPARRRAARCLGAVGCLLLLALAPAVAWAATGTRARAAAREPVARVRAATRVAHAAEQVQPPQPKPVATATVEQCEVSASEVSRAATFAGEMTAVPGTERMQMSVQLLERLPDEAAYHVVNAPGVSVWRSSAPGVQSYKYLRRVTNLAAPASYRADIRFRWLDAKGRTIEAMELRTRRCEEPAPPETSGAADVPTSASGA